MRTLIWTNTFLRAMKRAVRKHPHRQQDIEITLKLLVANPFAPQMETHKLKGKLSGSWACSSGRDLRIIFDFVEDAK
jgi:mRNA-degrading endonuclease YafQ of YafQ-DinJ toxin-antitoxin module